MYITLLKAKIHRATVTDANLHYEGSISIDDNLLKASGILPNEKVHVWNVTNGNRFETYTLRAPKGSGTICINGAAAHLAKKDDIIIITSFIALSPQKAPKYKPKVVLVDSKNKIVKKS